MYDELVKRLRSADAVVFRVRDLTLMQEAADAIESISKAYQMMAEAYEAEVTKSRWIPVTERLPGSGVDVLVKFPQNMAVASIDIGEWVVNSGDGWCTDINIAGGEKNPTHWMPLPEPPKEEP